MSRPIGLPDAAALTTPAAAGLAAATGWPDAGGRTVPNFSARSRSRSVKFAVVAGASAQQVPLMVRT